MMRTKTAFRLRTLVTFSIHVVILLPSLTKAIITPVGDIDPAYPGGSPDPWNVSGDLTIGHTGVGSIDVNDGSGIINEIGYIGRDMGSNGTVTITDPCSYWTNSGTLFVGSRGDANMVVSNGGTVTNTGGTIGSRATSKAYATITGPNSLWQNTSGLVVGYFGDSNMIISDGGRVTNASGYVAFGWGGAGLVTVTGPNSLWTNSGSLYVGDLGDGEMVVSDGGKVTNTYGYIGHYLGSSGTVTIMDPCSCWTNSSYLYIGCDGNDAELLISNGGRVTDVNGYIGYQAGSYGLVTITGPNSLWQNSNNLYVGSDGAADMVVSNGGHVTNINGYLGYSSNGIGSATVTGPDSLWENANNLHVGCLVDGSLLISNGGHVTAAIGVIGNASTSDGIATITGVDSLWENSTALAVGMMGDGEMIVSDGGKVTNTEGHIAYFSSANGIVTITDPNSLWENTENLYVGYDGVANMVVSNGGMVTNAHGYIAFEPNGVAIATITGPNSLWENSGNIFVGRNGDANIVVSNGGQVTSTRGFIGYNSGSSGTVTIMDPCSCWTNSSYLYIGYDSNDAEMLISNGGKVTDVNGHVGHLPGSHGLATITGPNSLWENSEELYIGNGEGRGEMVISDGGHVKDEHAYVGYAESEFMISSGIVTVTGSGSLWENTSDLVVGHKGQGILLISDGGHVTSADGIIGLYHLGGIYLDPPFGYWAPVSIATVTGPNSLWENSGDLIVGGKGYGEMVVSNGGRVTNVNGYIGFEEIGNGQVTVTGAGSVWENTGNLYIAGNDTGPEWTTGLLDVNDGGTVEADDIYILRQGTLSGDGNINVAGRVWSFGGAIEPGNSIGTITIDGDLTLDPNSTLEVEVDNNGNSDLLSVTGDVNILGGTVEAISTETITGTQQYTIVEANSVTGTFDILDTSAMLNTIVFEPNTYLGYGTDYVMLQITAMGFVDPNALYTDNQKAVGGALQKIADDGGNDVTTALQGLGTTRQLRGAYDQLCGQTRPQLAPVTIADTGRFMGTVSDGMHRSGFSYGRRGAPLFAMAGPDTNIGNMAYDTGSRGTNFALGNGTNSFGNQMWGFWGKGYGMYGDRDSENGVPGYKYTIYGTSFGFDYQVAEQSLLGITAGFSKSDVDYALPSSKADISGTHIGIYGSTSSNDWHFDSILTYSFLDYETERFVTLMGQKVRGDFDGTGINGYLEARYDWRSYDSWFVQPLASFQFSCLSLDSYIESGGTSRLMFDDQSYQSYKGSLGIKVTKELFEQDDSRSAKVQLRSRWLHEFGDDNSSVDASFASNPGTVFKVVDADVSRDSIVLGTGLNSRLNEYVQFTVDYDLSLNSDETAHLISAALQYRR